MFEKFTFPQYFSKILQECYTEQIDSFAKLFENKQFYYRVMGEMAKAMYLNLKNDNIKIS